MSWFKVETKRGQTGNYSFVGRSDLSIEELVARIESGSFIRLDELLYKDREKYRNWEEWDPKFLPTVHVNPADILTIMEYKGDPREEPKEETGA